MTLSERITAPDTAALVIAYLAGNTAKADELQAKLDGLTAEERQALVAYLFDGLDHGEREALVTHLIERHKAAELIAEYQAGGGNA